MSSEVQFYVLLESGPVSRTLGEIERMREANIVRDDTPIRLASEREWSTFKELFVEERVALPPLLPGQPIQSQSVEMAEDRGIGRCAFVFWQFAIVVGSSLMAGPRADQQTIAIISFPALLVLVALRLRNVGYNGWKCLLAIVPVANCVIALLCWVVPPNYATLGFREAQGRVNRRLIQRLQRWWKALLALFHGPVHGNIVPKKTVIIIACAALVVGWLLCWVCSDRYHFQAMGNGHMMRSDKWTGEAWVSYYGDQWKPVPRAR